MFLTKSFKGKIKDLNEDVLEVEFSWLIGTKYSRFPPSCSSVGKHELDSVARFQSRGNYPPGNYFFLVKIKNASKLESKNASRKRYTIICLRASFLE